MFRFIRAWPVLHLHAFGIQLLDFEIHMFPLKFLHWGSHTEAQWDHTSVS